MKSLCIALGVVLSAPHAAATSSPVGKVADLLRDLKARIEADSRSDQQVYDRFACWCEKTSDRKAQTITAAQASVRNLGQSVLQLKGTVASKITQMSDLTGRIRTNEESQQQATSIRQRENAQFMAETAEMKEVISALSKALEVLRDGTAGATFLQQGASTASAVRRVMEVMPGSSAVKPEQLAQLRAFAASGQGQGYAPQSATIQGILQDMYDTFTSDLETTTRDEGQRNTQYETLMSNKASQLQVMQEELRTANQQKVEAEVTLADGTQSYDDTRGELDGHVTFFDDTKAACIAKSQEWTRRKAMLQEELAGINKAIEILSSDSARELFASAIEPGFASGMRPRRRPAAGNASNSTAVAFLQLSEGSAPVDRAYTAIAKSARAAKSVRLASLAAKLKLGGHFDEVIASIDTMITTLKQEGAEDIRKRDQCKDEYTRINSTVADFSWRIQKNEVKIQRLQDLITELRQEKTNTARDIVDTQAQITTLQNQRSADNAAFLRAKQEDQDAIQLLTQAHDAISSYYTNHSIDMGPMGLLQQGPTFNVSEDQAPNATFSDAGGHKFESKGVLSILSMVIQDLNDEIANSQTAEEQAQLDFERQRTAASQLLVRLQAKEVNLEGMIATRTGEKDDEDRALSSNTQDRQTEEDYRTSIQADCDFILGAFQVRAENRAAEMDGLVQAKEYLAGYQPPGNSTASFLERQNGEAARRASSKFNDGVLAAVGFHSLSE